MRAGRFAKGKKNITILPWTTWDKSILEGYNIPALIEMVGLRDKVMNPKQYAGNLSDAGMAALYRAMDVCVLTTVGEGAGLPPIRARACGTPALVSANTSNVEFCGHRLEELPCYPDEGFSANEKVNPWGLMRFRTDIDVLVKRLDRFFYDRGLCKRVGEAGLAHVKQFETERCVPLWDEELRRCGF